MAFVWTLTSICDAPGLSLTTLAFSADGRRLFSCGTTEDGESILVEWNDETDGTIMRRYLGLGEQCVGVRLFDTTRNRFLVVADQLSVKFWDMDNVKILCTTDGYGGSVVKSMFMRQIKRFPMRPGFRKCLQFNREGTLMAVSTSDDCVKILANADGIELLSP